MKSEYDNQLGGQLEPVEDVPLPDEPLFQAVNDDSRASNSAAPDVVSPVADSAASAVPQADITSDEHASVTADIDTIVTLPLSNDAAFIYKIDLKRALQEANVSNPLLASRPASSVKQGETYRHAFKVKPGTKLSLSSAPQAMKATPAGTITWPVPKDATPEVHHIIVTITDAAGDEDFHTFKVEVLPAETRLGEPAATGTATDTEMNN